MSRPSIPTRPESELITNEPPSESPKQPEPSQEQLEPSQEKSALENVRFGKNKVFTRRKVVVPESRHAHESNLNPENEVTLSDPSLQSKIESHENNFNQDLPIAIRKGTRECTKRPLYPLANYLSFKHFSPSHKAFLVNLNTIAIPTTLSEALSNKRWKQAMNEEMEALEKNKT